MISIKDGKLYQWDTGRIVMCKAPEGMWIDEIHLDNYTTKNAIILDTYLDGDYVCAKIPDVVLQRLNPINIYTVMKVEDNEKTIESMQFNIIQRKKPEDYVYEEEEILRYDKLEKKIEELEEKIEDFEPGGGGGGGNVEITAESIKEALGYVPAKSEDVTTPDYSATEGEKGHILNRPFYEDVTIGELLPATTVGSEGNENFIPNTLSLKIGRTYTVNWNGTEYITVCKEYDGHPALGNIELVNGEGDTGEPFIILPIPPELAAELGVGGTVISILDDSTEVVVSIIGEKVELKKLDNKFLSLDWLPVYDGEVEVFPETSLESGSNIREIDFTTFNEGEKAIVYCDGVRYECICKSNNGYIMFGNVNIYNGVDTGEPFIVNSTYSKSIIMFIDGGEHTVSISKLNYKQIPKWYLPKDVFEYVKELKFIDPFTDANVSVRADQKGLYVLASDGTVLAFLPNSSSFYDNYEGKVLKVVDGMPTWSEIPSGGNEEELDINVIEKYVAYVSGGSFISKNDGKIYYGANYGSTDFIPVKGGESIKINGFYCPNGTNASVCVYDSNFTFVSPLIINETDSGNGKTVLLEDNAAYIRATSENTGSIVVCYIDRSLASETIEEAPYNLGTLTSNCFVSKDNGEILSNTSYYGATDFVEVTARYLKIENPNLSGNCGICEYDKNKNFISCLLYPEVYSGQYVVKLSKNAKYIRATVVNNNANWLRLYPVLSAEDLQENEIIDSWMVSTGNQIKKPFEKINKLLPTITFIDDDTMRYDAVKRYHNIFSSFGKSKNLYNKTARTDGYTIHSQTGDNYASDGYSVSDYIPVDENAQYTFSRNGVIAPTWLLSVVAFYGSGRNFISVAASKEATFTTPEGAAYLRFSTSTVRMEGSEEEGYIQLEKGSIATPYEEYSVGLHNVKGCYGVITDYIDRDENLKNLLLSYEDEGYGMLFHAKWQDTYYMEGDNRNIILAESDYCQGMRKMRNIGFVDYNYWVSPYGVTDKEITSMCKRHGANCLLSTSNNTFIQNNGLNGNYEPVDRYALPRCSLGYNDSQYPNFTLADLKAQIDKCVQVNGWLIITTHVQQWAEEYGTTPDERLKEIIQYALDKKCEIKTFAEAYAERNGILRINDIC